MSFLRIAPEALNTPLGYRQLTGSTGTDELRSTKVPTGSASSTVDPYACSKAYDIGPAADVFGGHPSDLDR